MKELLKKCSQSLALEYRIESLDTLLSSLKLHSGYQYPPIYTHKRGWFLDILWRKAQFQAEELPGLQNLAGKVHRAVSFLPVWAASFE